jgi:hypothetical protein
MSKRILKLLSRSGWEKEMCGSLAQIWAWTGQTFMSVQELIASKKTYYSLFILKYLLII